MRTEEEAIIVTFGKHTLLPHVCRYIAICNVKTAKKNFNKYPIGYLHINIAERATEGKLQISIAIARICKFAYAKLHEKKTKMIAAELLRNLFVVLP